MMLHRLLQFFSPFAIFVFNQKLVFFHRSESICLLCKTLVQLVNDFQELRLLRYESEVELAKGFKFYNLELRSSLY